MKFRHHRPSNQGVIAIGLALIWVVLLGIVAVVIDLGFALVTRNQLQNITDGAALAGTRQLGRLYEGLSPAEQQGFILTSADKSTILDEVTDLGLKNAAGGTPIQINAADVVIGRWSHFLEQLIPTSSAPDTVKILARRDEQANSPLTTSFAQILGTDSIELVSQSTAALTGISEVMSRQLNAPIGLARAWFNNSSGFCSGPMQFFPVNTPESCVGWHTFAAQTSSLLHTLNGLLTGSITGPRALAGDAQFRFTDIAPPDAGQTVEAFQALYAAKSTCPTTGLPCESASCSTACQWPVLIGVYDFPNCSSPTTTVTIVGFATAVIHAVEVSPAPLITGRIECGMVQAQARGGGPNFGTKGSIPGLVQ